MRFGARILLMMPCVERGDGACLQVARWPPDEARDPEGARLLHDHALRRVDAADVDAALAAVHKALTTMDPQHLRHHWVHVVPVRYPDGTPSPCWYVSVGGCVLSPQPMRFALDRRAGCAGYPPFVLLHVLVGPARVLDALGGDQVHPLSFAGGIVVRRTAQDWLRDVLAFLDGPDAGRWCRWVRLLRDR